MLRIKLQTLAKVALLLLIALVLASLLWFGLLRVAQTAVALSLGILFAYLLDPIIRYMQRWVKQRRLAVAILSLSLAGLLVGAVALLAGPIAEQTYQLANDLPEHLERLRQQDAAWTLWLTGYGIDVREMGLDLESQQARLLDLVQTSGRELLTDVLGIIGGISGALVVILFSAVITVYLLLDGAAIWEYIVSLMPAEQQRHLHRTTETLNRVVGGYVRGQMLVAVIVGLASGVGMRLIGVEYYLVIGLFAALFQFVPILGPVLAAGVAVVVAAVQGPFILAVYTLLIFVVIQQVESNWLSPRIVGTSVGMHPLSTMLALVAGLEVAGLAGGIIAIPVVGVAAALAREFLFHNEEEARPIEQEN